MERLEKELEMKLREHNHRLFNLKHIIGFYKYCIDEAIYYECKSELCCLGSVIIEYASKTKEEFNHIQDKIGIDY